MIESMASGDFVVVCDDRKLANWNKDMELPKIPPEKRKKISDILDNFVESSLYNSTAEDLKIAVQRGNFMTEIEKLRQN